MSRAFVKEDSTERWTPPAARRAYRLIWRGGNGTEMVGETDDLLGALRWLSARGPGDFEVRDRGGVLIATAGG